MKQEKSTQYFNNIETIFKLLGTQEQPSEARSSLLEIVDTYHRACRKTKHFTNTHKELQNLFNQEPHLSLFQVFIEADESGYYIASLQLNTSGGDINSDEVQWEIRDILDYDREILGYLHQHTVTISRDNLQKIFSNYLTSEESAIFNDIENFEKNKLEKEIFVSAKKDKALKI